jgi:hypothetical protein
MLFIFSTPALIRHLWQLKTVVFQHWCLKRAVPLVINTWKFPGTEHASLFTTKYQLEVFFNYLDRKTLAEKKLKMCQLRFREMAGAV